jgi:hypothetical protein
LIVPIEGSIKGDRCKSPCPNTREHERLEKLIVKHSGVLTKMALSMKCTRQGLAAKIRRHGLRVAATTARHRARISGPRGDTTFNVRDERALIIAALGKFDTIQDAGVSVKIPKRTLYRKISQLGITKADIDAARTRHRARTRNHRRNSDGKSLII